MKITCQRVGSVDVILPDGTLGEDNAEEFLGTIRGQMASPNPHIVISMQDVAFIDSVGLDTLLQVADELKNRSLKLKLATLTATAREILYITDQLDEFELFDDVHDAVRSFMN